MNTTLSFFTLLSFLIGCGSKMTPQTGTLEVSVSISPLCGMVPANLPPSNNPCGLSDAEVDAIYGAYHLVVNEVQKNQVIEEIKLDRKGHVFLKLPIGDYTVQIAPNLFPSPENKEPVLVKITENQRVQVTFKIQTGMR